MSEPTGRWIKRTAWACPSCGAVHPFDRARCSHCYAGVRPSFSEPIRPWDPADLIGPSDSPRVRRSALRRLAARAARGERSV